VVAQRSHTKIAAGSCLTFARAAFFDRHQRWHLFPMASTLKESQMTTSLGTVSEMTKGYIVGPLQDDPMKPNAFPQFQQVP
jgi:hypothetical protein